MEPENQEGPGDGLYEDQDREALLQLLHDKDNQLYMAAHYGNELLEQNQYLLQQQERIRQDYQEELENLSQDNYTLKKKLENTTLEYESVTKDLQQDIQELQKERDQSNHRHEKPQPSGVYTQQLEYLQNELQQVKIENETLRSELESLHKELMFNKQQCQGIIEEREEFYQQVSVLIQENQQSQNNLRLAKEQEEILTKRLGCVKGQLEQVQDTCSMKNVEIQRRNSEIEELREENLQLVQQLLSAQKHWQSTNNSVDLFNELEYAVNSTAALEPKTRADDVPEPQGSTMVKQQHPLKMDTDRTCLVSMGHFTVDSVLEQEVDIGPNCSNTDWNDVDIGPDCSNTDWKDRTLLNVAAIRRPSLNCVRSDVQLPTWTTSARDTHRSSAYTQNSQMNTESRCRDASPEMAPYFESHDVGSRHSEPRGVSDDDSVNTLDSLVGEVSRDSPVNANSPPQGGTMHSTQEVHGVEMTINVPVGRVDCDDNKDVLATYNDDVTLSIRNNTDERLARNLTAVTASSDGQSCIINHCSYLLSDIEDPPVSNNSTAGAGSNLENLYHEMPGRMDCSDWLSKKRQECMDSSDWLSQKSQECMDSSDWLSENCGVFDWSGPAPDDHTRDYSEHSDCSHDNSSPSVAGEECPRLMMDMSHDPQGEEGLQSWHRGGHVATLRQTSFNMKLCGESSGHSRLKIINKGKGSGSSTSQADGSNMEYDGMMNHDAASSQWASQSKPMYPPLTIEFFCRRKSGKLNAEPENGTYLTCADGGGRLATDTARSQSIAALNASQGEGHHVRVQNRWQSVTKGHLAHANSLAAWRAAVSHWYGPVGTGNPVQSEQGTQEAEVTQRRLRLKRTNAQLHDSLWPTAEITGEDGRAVRDDIEKIICDYRCGSTPKKVDISVQTGGATGTSVCLSQKVIQSLLDSYCQLEQLIQTLRGKSKALLQCDHDTDITMILTGGLQDVVSELQFLISDWLKHNTQEGMSHEQTAWVSSLRQQNHRFRAEINYMRGQLKEYVKHLGKAHQKIKVYSARVDKDQQLLRSVVVERDKLLFGYIEPSQISADEIVRKLRAERDAVLESKMATEDWLKSANSSLSDTEQQLMDAVQQKLQLAQQLELWQVDMHELISKKVMDHIADQPHQVQLQNMDVTKSTLMSKKKTKFSLFTKS